MRSYSWAIDAIGQVRYEDAASVKARTYGLIIPVELAAIDIGTAFEIRFCGIKIHDRSQIGQHPTGYMADKSTELTSKHGNYTE